MSARRGWSEEPPLRVASYDYDDGPFLVPSGSEKGRVLPMLFSAHGRMSRVQYCILSFVSAVTYLLACVTLRLTLQPLAATLIVLPLSVAFLWSFIAIWIKRWHDRDKSGWWCLLALLPVVGWVWSAVECRYRSGTRGPNRFGDDPRGQVRPGEVFA